MKITSVDVILVTLGRAATESSPWNPTIIRIHTDMGISGYGEMGLTYGRAKNAAYGMAQDFGRLILGMDPMDNEKIWDKLHRSTFWGLGNGGIVMSAISAIDIALWDIKGKALGFPAISCWAVRPTRSCGLTPVRFSLTGARRAAAWCGRRNTPKRPSRP